MTTFWPFFWKMSGAKPPFAILDSMSEFLTTTKVDLRLMSEAEDHLPMDHLSHSVLVRIFRRHYHLASETCDNFEILVLRFCSHNPTSRQYFLKSDASLYVRDMLMRKPQSPFLLNRLISCRLLVPLARYLALRDFHNTSMSHVIMSIMGIFSKIVEHNRADYLLEKPILSYLTQSFNHPYAICGIIFFGLCSLGDDAKVVVNPGPLPGLCRLAHPDSYAMELSSHNSSQGSEHWHLPYEGLLVAIAGIDSSCATKVAKA
ncbi:hypothetical protein BS47DRAFT_1386141 [Hydnum rufescens UP504]|uniref:Uncharacterized protein n=1 Tax=Hydnum rufescens UP504 TaxID=1448309 RepID=A0A9P6DNP7_9AGAM|nr:hypothetical protein BS47DRAFT_1386141 [Hydnum rufescens UP504]